MPICATCGTTQDLRLYEVRGVGDEPRRWWCGGCRFLGRRLGVQADPVPVWIERAAMRSLPPKPIQVSPERRLAASGRRATDRAG